MSWSTALRTYASTKDPSTLPDSVLYSYTDSTITVIDAYPKALFHLLVLPRPTDRFSVSDLDSLRTLAKKSKTSCLDVLNVLESESEGLKDKIRKEMEERYGFSWPVLVGFHAVPSMEHIHLHVISSDLTSPSLKNKKHYNSFKPGLGFFLPLQEVMGWFDKPDKDFAHISALKKSDYEPLLKQDLVCHCCKKPFRNIPQLKTHLQEQWDASRRQKARKRKLPDDADQGESQSPDEKRTKTREDGAS